MNQQVSDTEAEIICNSLLRKDLLAEVGGGFYDLGVKNAALWKAVGAALKAARLRQGFASERDFWLRFRGPSINTIKEIEAGRAGNTDSLDTYADNLGVELSSIIAAETAKDDGASQTLSADAYFVGLMFEKGAKANDDLTRSIWGMARLIQKALEDHESQTRGSSEKPAAAARPRRRANASVKRSVVERLRRDDERP